MSNVCQLTVVSIEFGAVVCSVSIMLAVLSQIREEKDDAKEGEIHQSQKPSIDESNKDTDPRVLANGGTRVDQAGGGGGFGAGGSSFGSSFDIGTWCCTWTCLRMLARFPPLALLHKVHTSVIVTLLARAQCHCNIVAADRSCAQQGVLAPPYSRCPAKYLAFL